MVTVPTKVATRIAQGIRAFQPVLESARARDINESDTVTIVKDMLAQVFGYDKYAEVTSEFAIKGSYVDLAVKMDGKPYLLIEVKAVGTELDEKHLRQAVDYGANEGIEWVALTNGVTWRAYKITFAKPITQELVVDIDFLALNPRSDESVSGVFALTREGVLKSALQVHLEQRQASNPYVMAAIVLSEPVVDMIRREVRRLNAEVRLTEDEVRAVLVEGVLKRDVTDGEKADAARAKVKRAGARSLRVQGKDDAPATTTSTPNA